MVEDPEGSKGRERGVCRERAEGRVLHVSRPPDRIGKMEIIRVASWGGCMAGCTNGRRRGCSGVQRNGARGAGRGGRGDGGGGWLSRWDGDGVGGCAQCSMRPGPDRLIGNTHRSSCARGISHVCSIVGGGGGGGEGKKSGAGGGRRRKGGGKRGGHIA